MRLKDKLKVLKISWIHILIIFLSLIIFQIFVSHLQQNTLRNILSDTMDWYKRNSAEQIGNLTTTSLELLMESESKTINVSKQKQEDKIIHALNSVLKQPLMKRNVEKMCVIVEEDGKFIPIDLGVNLHSYFLRENSSFTINQELYEEGLDQYSVLHTEMKKTEMVTSIQEKESLFHVFVPLVTYGEYRGAVYLKIRPDVSFISDQILASFNQMVIIFSSLIILGFLGMFYLTTYIVVERDEARELLFKEQESHLQEQVAQSKEKLFTKRIYHTHHKAEKIMGFINEDLKIITERNINEIRYRISKYANFISRVIYDMKWYNPPIQTIRGVIFRTDINEVLKFIIDNIFLRISLPTQSIKFHLNLDENMPKFHVNEFVAWEVIEPLIQNSIDHSDKRVIEITIKTIHNEDSGNNAIIIEDNGSGIETTLLEKNSDNKKIIFLENISTKEEEKNCGYGCYLAYEIAKRCGWELDAENKEPFGARFTITLNS